MSGLEYPAHISFHFILKQRKKKLRREKTQNEILAFVHSCYISLSI